jgi:hypothetical protein
VRFSGKCRPEIEALTPMFSGISFARFSLDALALSWRAE